MGCAPSRGARQISEPLIPLIGGARPTLRRCSHQPYDCTPLLRDRAPVAPACVDLHEEPREIVAGPSIVGQQGPIVEIPVGELLKELAGSPPCVCFAGVDELWPTRRRREFVLRLVDDVRRVFRVMRR